MRTDIQIVAEPGRLPRWSCRGSLQVRATAPDTVHLIGIAANPLGGDQNSISIEVHAGATLNVRTVAAAVALPGRASPRSQARWDCAVAGTLDLDPEPTVVAADASHHSAVRVAATDGARLRIRERVQIGRSGESDGFWSGTLDVDVDTVPLLRHRLEIGAGSACDDMLARPRALISELRYPATDFTPAMPASIVLALAGGATLLTWQGERLPADG